MDSEDVVVAIWGSMLLCILRHSNDTVHFTFVGVADIPHDKKGLEVPHDAKDALWYMLLTHNQHRLEDFQIK